MYPRCWSGFVGGAAALHARPGDPPHAPAPGPSTHSRLLGRPPSCPQLVCAAALRSRFVSGWATGPRGEAGCASLMAELPGHAGE